MKFTCPTCNTSYRNIDRDEDGIAQTPTIKCADPNCPTLLCPYCASFSCAGCGQTFCVDHGIEEQEQDYDCTCQQTDADQFSATWCFAHNPRIQPRPDKFCASCFEESEVAEWPEIDKISPITVEVKRMNIPEWTGGEAA